MEGEITTNVATGMQTWRYTTDTGLVRLEPHGWTMSARGENRYFIHPDDPNSARMELQTTDTYFREGWLDVRIEARHTLTSDETHFIIDAGIEVYENDQQVFEREWHERIARDGV